MLLLTSFFNVLVNIITARWGVWDVVVGHEVNLERSLQATQINKGEIQIYKLYKNKTNKTVGEKLAL